MTDVGELKKRVASAFSIERALRGDSLRDAAEQMGVSASTLSRAERGIYGTMTLELFVAMVDYVDPDVGVKILGETNGAE